MASFELQPQIQYLYFLSLVTLFLHFSRVSSQPSFENSYLCRGSNFTSNSQYEDNLNQLLSLLPTKIKSDTNFYNDSSGDYPDKVYGVLLCRGDLDTDDCGVCAQTAVDQITQRCPNSKEYISWYSNCMFRYSDRYIFSVMEEKPEWILHNSNNVTNEVSFQATATKMMDGLVTTATTANKEKLFATGEVNFTFSQKIYGLVQCTPDITADECRRCLLNEVGSIRNCCYGKRSGTVLRPSCTIRYDSYLFYAPTATSGKRKKPKIILKVVTPVVIALLQLATFAVVLRLRKKGKASTTFDDMDDITNVESLRFDLKTIRHATNKFSLANKLGKGGFGLVYKGTLSYGQETAVKRLSIISGQGKKEFKTEVELLVKLQHRNLVRLLGFCLEREEKLLVYEFVPNGSLDQILFDPLKSINLNWETRYKIIGGIAKGILYLHEDSRLKIIHRDLKASNVLLDNEMNAKISDFGMAKLFEMDQTRGHSSIAVGTYGYIAPEYALYGRFSAKSDVYSFGVLLLEIITGKKVNHFDETEHAEYLLNYVWRNWQEETALEVIDKTIRDCFSENEVMKCIQIGLLSVQDVKERPTMAYIVQVLTTETTNLPVPSAPALFHLGPIQMQMTSEEDTSRGTRSDTSIQLTHPSKSSKQSSQNQFSISKIITR